MDSLKYPKQKILNVLRENREAHIKIVREAQKGYREKAIELFEEKLALLKASKAVDPNIRMQVPVNHTDQFDQAIQMLEMSVGDEIELDMNQFQSFVMNKWQWQGQFLASNSMYSGTAAQALDSVVPE